MSEKFFMAIDAGHGRYSGGNRCMAALDPNQTAEWVLGDRVARAIAERARLYEGFRTIRVDDASGEEDVRLGVRCDRANEAGVDFYLSCHFDAGICGGYGGGVTAFCVALGGEAERYRDELYSAVTAAGGLQGNRANPLQTANFYVLRNTDAPAVLMEFGFMDSPSDVPVILQERYTTAVGHAVADCLAEMKGLKRIGSFVDVLPDTYCYQAVEWAVKEGITVGTGDDRFSPEDPCTRAQAVTMLWRHWGRPKVQAEHPFVDVEAGSFYEEAARWAYAEGITVGTGDGCFSPEDACTRAQVVTMLYRAAGSPAVTEEQGFADVPEDSYCAKAVAWAKAKGITAGVGDNCFAPEDACIRGELVTFLYRA